MISRAIYPTNGTVSGNVSLPHKQDTFSVRCFERYDEHPAELCDGGDYTKELTIQLDDKGMVRIVWERSERSGTHLLRVPYPEFFDKFADFAEALEKEQKSE